MKKFLLKIFIYSGIILSCCYLLEYIIDEGIKRSSNQLVDDWNKIFTGKINSDIIVLGSSRASGQFNSRILEEKLGYSTYNLGIGGGKIILEEARWNSYLKFNNPPKILIQNIDIFSSRPENGIVSKRQFLPFLSECTVSASLEKIDPNVFYESIIPLYKYRGLRKDVVKGIKSFFYKSQTTSLASKNGYIPFDKKWNNEFDEYKSKNKTAEFNWEDVKVGIEFLEKLIIDCQKRGIKIFLVHAPMYIELQRIMPQKTQYDSIIKKISQDYQIDFLDYSNDSLCYSKDYFYNGLHLNSHGANLFTQKLADTLAVILK